MGDKAGSTPAIMYTALDPSRDDQDGDSALDTVISAIDDTVVVQKSKNRDWPAIAVDSLGVFISLGKTLGTNWTNFIHNLKFTIRCYFDFP